MVIVDQIASRAISLKLSVYLVAYILAVLSLFVISSKASEETGIYPCQQCHAVLNVTGLVREETVHDKNLTIGAHRGLYCANCHKAPTVWIMEGLNDTLVEIGIKDIHSREKLDEMNLVCAKCHYDIYEDYTRLAHGNSTFVCEEGRIINVAGYKGVIYSFHECKEYSKFTPVPARACVECHNPHNPTMEPLSILPKQNYVAPTPKQDNVVYGTLAVTITAMSLIVLAIIRGERR